MSETTSTQPLYLSFEMLVRWLDRLVSQYDNPRAPPPNIHRSNLRIYLNDVRHLSAVLHGTEAARPERSVTDVRLLLAAGLCAWRPPQAAVCPPDVLTQLGAATVWPLVVVPALRLPVRWQSDLLSLTGYALKTQVFQMHRDCHASTTAEAALAARLSAVLNQPAYTAGVGALLAELADEQRGGAAVTALCAVRAAGQPVRDPAGARMLHLLNVLLADLPGISFAELAAHQHDALLARAWDMLHDEGIDVRGYLQQAAQHASEGAYAQAIAAYTQVLTIQPECADAYVGRGQVYFQQKNYKQAIAEYRQALQLAPDNAAAYHYRGEAHDRLGNEHNAKQDFARARRRGFRRS